MLQVLTLKRRRIELKVFNLNVIQKGGDILKFSLNKNII
jgi:hypothetical protein